MKHYQKVRYQTYPKLWQTGPKRLKPSSVQSMWKRVLPNQDSFNDFPVSICSSSEHKFEIG